MMTVAMTLTWLVTILAAVSGFCWYRAATIVVKAPQHIKSEGALYGGFISMKTATGFIDVMATYRKQSDWNRYAAASACAGAFLTSVLWIGQAYNWL